MQKFVFPSVSAMLLLLFLGLSSFAPEANPQAYTLRLNLETGDTYTMETITDQVINQVINGMEQEILQKTGYVHRYEVMGRAGENYRLQVTYEAIVYEQETGGRKISYDSRDSAAQVPMQAKGFAGLVDESFEMVLSPTGELVELSGMDQMIDKVVANMELPEAVRAQVRTMLEDQMGNQSMKSNMAQAMAFFPEQPVDPGDTWSSQSQLRTSMILDLDTQYELLKVEDGRAYLGLKGTMDSAPDAEPSVMMGMQMTFDMAGDQSGTIVVDLDTGKTLSVDIDQTFSGDVSATGGQMGDQSLEFPMVIESHTASQAL
jgi:hypothetical protein